MFLDIFVPSVKQNILCTKIFKENCAKLRKVSSR